MAEAVLSDIVEQIVEESEAGSKALSNEVLTEVEPDKDNTSASDSEKTSEVLRKQKSELDEVDAVHTETDKEVESESDPCDDIPTDDNSNDFLTTEDEAEDFLTHVLRDTNDSDQDFGKATKGMSCDSVGETLGENEERLNIASALINFGSAQSDIEEKPDLTSEQISGKDFNVDLEANIKQPVTQGSAYLSNTSSIDIKDYSKSSVAVDNTGTSALLSNDMTLDLSKSSSDSSKMSSVCDINNNNDTMNNNVNNLFDDTSLFKYDWSKCLNPYTISDSRSLSTPDAEMDNISPDLSCLMQLSPTATYGKDHTIGCQRLYSRQNLGCSSTLNTPDPVLYDDTDSNESSMAAFRKYGTCMAENTMSAWPPETDVNNTVDGTSKGVKRKHGDVSDKDGTSNILSDSVVTSIMNQGRPPDISTWRAVNSSFDTQGNFVTDDINGQWNKPTCTVQPFQNTGHFNDTFINGSNTFGTNQQAMFTSTAYNAYDLAASFSMNQFQYNYNQYNSNPLLRPSCQFTSNQAMDASIYRPQLYNSGLQSSASYRLDFSSPVNNNDTTGVLNFVSHPQYVGVNLSRPRAVHANNLQNSGYNTSYRYSSMPNQPVLSSGGFRNYYPTYSQIGPQVPAQSSFMNQFNQTTTDSRGPSATQTFSESLVNNTQNSTLVNGNRDDAKNASDNQIADVNNNNKKMDVDKSSKKEKKSETIVIGCEDCDNISGSSDQEMVENDVSKDNENNMLAKGNDTETGNKDVFLMDDTTDNQDKALDKSIQSNEADSTTIDLTCDTNDVDQDTVADKQVNPSSPTPVHSYPKIQNKYFTEIYMRKNRCNSPITSFCTALDLSKREQKKERKKAAKPLVTIPQNIRPICEPPIPVSAVLNTLPAPALAYSGAMLVPYMNSIFAAMANMNKNQTLSSVSNFTNPIASTNVVQDDQNTISDDSPLKQTNNLTLNQQVLMYSNLHANLSAMRPTVTTDSNGTSQSTINSAVVNTPTLNVNSLPLPLYATPLQYPIRPLQQGFMNPCMYRFNFGVPIDTAAANTNLSYSNTSLTNNNTVNTASSTFSNINNNTASSTFSNINNNTASSTFSNTYPHSASTASSNIAKSVNSQAKPTKSRSSSQRGRARREFGLVPGTTKTGMSGTKTFSAPTGRSLSAVEGVSMSIQGSKCSAAKATPKRSLVTYQPVPDGKMFQTVADRKKRVFKAKHFPFTLIGIGEYKYSCACDRVARVKFLFSKKLMVYEFQLESPDGSLGVCKEMVEISVPFWSIIGLWMYERDMRVEVKEAPKICLGKKGPEKNVQHKTTVYNRKLHKDVTMGELFRSPYHYVQFKNNCADRLKAELKDFDKSFDIMFRLPLIEDTGKSLKPGTKQIINPLLDPSIFLPTEDVNNNDTGVIYDSEKTVEISENISCSCTNGCSAGTCQCCVKGTTCTEGLCECLNCRNPLNILHQLGLAADRARTDPCLMENIYQIKRLDCYVKTQLVLECCHIPVLLFNCIPGEIKCVNQQCAARYKYSWCTARLLNENSTPRNHCINCGRCTDYRNKHCQKCKICYFGGEGHTLSCPVCQSRNNNVQEINSSTESDA